jgi:hypothetical protein
MTDQALWWIALGIGAVVLVVALLLLQVFYGKVRQIEEGAQAIWHAGKQVAGNTANTWQLDVTAQRLDALADEAGRHDALLRGGRSA